jgi:hypothetical protein
MKDKDRMKIYHRSESKKIWQPSGKLREGLQFHSEYYKEANFLVLKFYQWSYK